MRNWTLLLFSLFIGCASHVSKGDCFFEEGKWDEAVREYQLGSNEIHGKPNEVANVCNRMNNAVAFACRDHLAKAQAAYLLGDVTTATRELSQAENMRPDSQEIRKDLTDLKTKLNNLDPRTWRPGK